MGKGRLGHKHRPINLFSTINFDRRMVYSPHAQPGLYEGLPCVFVNARIRETEPLAYAFLESFAQDNELKLVPWEP